MQSVYWIPTTHGLPLTGHRMPHPATSPAHAVRAERLDDNVSHTPCQDIHAPTSTTIRIQVCRLFQTWYSALKKKNHLRSKDTQETFHLLAYSWKACNSQVCKEPKPGAWDSISVSKVGGTDPSTWAATCCLQRCTIRRRLDWQPQPGIKTRQHSVEHRDLHRSAKCRPLGIPHLTLFRPQTSPHPLYCVLGMEIPSHPCLCGTPGPTSRKLLCTNKAGCHR